MWGVLLFISLGESNIQAVKDLLALDQNKTSNACRFPILVQNYLELHKYVESVVMAHIWYKNESRDIVVSFSANVLETEHVKPMERETNTR